MNPEISVMEIDKSKFYLIGIRFEDSINYEVIDATRQAIEKHLVDNDISACVIPLGLNAQDIAELDESLSKDLLEIIQQYRDKKLKEIEKVEVGG